MARLYDRTHSISSHCISVAEQLGRRSHYVWSSVGIFKFNKIVMASRCLVTIITSRSFRLFQLPYPRKRTIIHDLQRHHHGVRSQLRPVSCQTFLQPISSPHDSQKLAKLQQVVITIAPGIRTAAVSNGKQSAACDLHGSRWLNRIESSSWTLATRCRLLILLSSVNENSLYFPQRFRRNDIVILVVQCLLPGCKRVFQQVEAFDLFPNLCAPSRTSRLPADDMAAARAISSVLMAEADRWLVWMCCAGVFAWTMLRQHERMTQDTIDYQLWPLALDDPFLILPTAGRTFRVNNSLADCGSVSCMPPSSWLMS